MTIYVVHLEVKIRSLRQLSAKLVNDWHKFCSGSFLLSKGAPSFPFTSGQVTCKFSFSNLFLAFGTESLWHRNAVVLILFSQARPWSSCNSSRTTVVRTPDSMTETQTFSKPIKNHHSSRLGVTLRTSSFIFLNLFAHDADLSSIWPQTICPA